MMYSLLTVLSLAKAVWLARQLPRVFIDKTYPKKNANETTTSLIWVVMPTALFKFQFSDCILCISLDLIADDVESSPACYNSVMTCNGKYLPDEGISSFSFSLRTSSAALWRASCRLSITSLNRFPLKVWHSQNMVNNQKQTAFNKHSIYSQYVRLYNTLLWSMWAMQNNGG